ncbi:MAG TPA: hypothetical protein PLV03_02460 [Clostridiales bacterium]|nr:hypothetical protein [Clostridiales bacterium]
MDDKERIAEQQADKPKVYAVDFDGYLCDSAWPEIGEPHTDIIEHFKMLKLLGNKLILNTCRERELLQNAIDWCAGHGLYFDAHNENLQETIDFYGRGDCRKISADFYCDDKNYWLMPKKDEDKQWQN